MLKGLRTVTYPAPDMNAAKAWYTEALGVAPHFDQPFYVGFAVGGFELGLAPGGPTYGGTVAYWGVDDIASEVVRLKNLGATVKNDISDVGDGIKVAQMNDPFGNVLGLIYNPNFNPGAIS